MNRRRFKVAILCVLWVVAISSLLSAQERARPRPIKALLITGGCCHDYARQKEILKRGIESRAMVEVTLLHSDDRSTKARFDIYENPDPAKWMALPPVTCHDNSGVFPGETFCISNTYKHFGGAQMAAQFCNRSKEMIDKALGPRQAAP